MLCACWPLCTRLVSCSTEENCAIWVTDWVGSCCDWLSGSWFCISATRSCRNPSWPRIAAGLDADVVGGVPTGLVVGETLLIPCLLCEYVDLRSRKGQLRRLDRGFGLVVGGVVATVGPHCVCHVGCALSARVASAVVAGEVHIEAVDGDALGFERAAQ